MIPIWQAALFGVLLFIAYLLCLVVALRQQKRIHDRQLAKVRGQRDRARTALRRLRGQPARRHAWATAAPIAVVKAEFDKIVKGGER